MHRAGYPTVEPKLIGVSRNIRQMRKLIIQIVDTFQSVIVWGETGVGKELIIRSLYRKSGSTGKPFIKVNFAAMPDTLLESEMFGYEKGVFTGAARIRHGKFELSNSGVLFLDEIGDMPRQLQSKLLHVLQLGDFSPLGSGPLNRMYGWLLLPIETRNRTWHQKKPGKICCTG